jgi:glycosyltransferase involved in cell wall biosynthesis
VLPVFNGGRELGLAVESILAQSFVDWELLVIDDGSVDGAAARLDAIGDPRIRVFRDSRNLGLAARLNQGVSIARGRYIARMDHDDVAHQDRLAHQVAFLEREPGVDLCGACCVAMDEREQVIGALPAALTHEQICARPWRGFHLAHPTWLGRTDWFRRNPYRDPGPFRCEDQELLLRTYTTSRFAAVPEALLSYRVRGGPKFSTLVRTRASLAREQWTHFSQHRAPGTAALSLLVAAARITMDAARSLTGGRAPVRRKISPDEEREWEAIIKNLHDRVEQRNA